MYPFLFGAKSTGEFGGAGGGVLARVCFGFGVKRLLISSRL